MTTGVKARAEIIHHVPGRLRIRVAGIRRDTEAASRVSTALSRCAGIESVEANPLTGSILIRYDCAHTSALRVLASAAELGSELVRAPGTGRNGTFIAGPEAPIVCSACGARSNKSDVTHTIGRWLVRKTMELAIEKSLVLAVAAIL